MAGDPWVDLHNHVVPGVDDGAPDVPAALSALSALEAEGVRRVVTTPHVSASLALRPGVLERRLAELDAGWQRLLEALPDGGAVRMDRGVELRLDIPDPDLTDPRLRLAGGPAVLLEFAAFRIPPRSPATLGAIREAGYLPILAHPERYEGVDRGLRVVAEWLQAGVALQVNTGSLLGRYGRRAQLVARSLLERGWVHCLASDYHARGAPQLATVRSAIESWHATHAARRLFEENPSRLLRGEPCLPVSPITPARDWLGWLRGLRDR